MVRPSGPRVEEVQINTLPNHSSLRIPVPFLPFLRGLGEGGCSFCENRLKSLSINQLHIKSGDTHQGQSSLFKPFQAIFLNRHVLSNRHFDTLPLHSCFPGCDPKIRFQPRKRTSVISVLSCSKSRSFRAADCNAACGILGFQYHPR